MKQNMIQKVTALSLLAFLAVGCTSVKNNRKDGTTESKYSTAYKNPMQWADMPDPSVTRAGDTFYFVSTTMHLMPGAPVMKSTDLVNWEYASYVFDRIEDTPKYDLKEGTVYGRGQWATSIRYHKGKFYVLFSPNDEPYRSYIYETDDPSSGDWKLVTRTKHFHDASLFFNDDGRVFVFYGTGNMTELKEDLSDVKPGGVDMKIFEKDAGETGLLEGSHVIKHDGHYYLLMISWPQGGKRRQVCYRAENITGPYEKKVILEDNFADFPYVGQGCLIDDDQGNWYGVIFQDRSAVGRVPLVMPVRWEDGWPMLGDENGKVPLTGTFPLKTFEPKNKLVDSDDFSGDKLRIQWQWNHNPINDAWSLTERPGYLRLKTNRVVDNLYLAPNTITQRMEGPTSSGSVALDLSQMKDGDVAGFSAFNGHSAVLGIQQEGDKRFLSMSEQVVDLEERTKAVLDVERTERERVELDNDVVYLRIDGDFNLGKDIATCYYSLDNKDWKKIGKDFQMRYDYQKLFMGSRFAIFNYATKANGGYVDVDFFDYSKGEK